MINAKKSLSIILISCIYILASQDKSMAEVKRGGISITPIQQGTETRGRFIFNNVKPGETLNDTIVIKNTKTQKASVKIYAVDTINADGGGIAPIPPDMQSKYVGNWIMLETNEVQLMPNEQKTIKFEVKIPIRVEPRDYSGTILAEETTPNEKMGQNNTSVAVRTRIGNGVYISIIGEKYKKFTIQEFIFEEAKDKATFVVNVINDGNARVEPTSIIKIFDGEKLVDQLSQKMGNILAFSSSKFHINWKDKKYGKFIAQIAVDIGDGKIVTEETRFERKPQLNTRERILQNIIVVFGLIIVILATIILIKFIKR